MSRTSRPRLEQDAPVEKYETGTTFDTYAASYERALAQGVAVSGESSAFFARGRVAWLASLLAVTMNGPRP